MRLIDADRLRNIAISNRDVEMVYEIDHSPTVERPHGEWIDRNGNSVFPFWERYECSKCGARSDNTNFCPNCGADMREGDMDG